MTIRDSILDALPVGVWVARAPGGELEYANHEFKRIMGMDAIGSVAAGEYAQPYGIFRRDGTLYPESQMPFVRALEAKRTVVVDDIVIHRRDGARINIRAFASPLYDDKGALTHIMIAFIDITREVEAERRLVQASRMESIGQLARGTAHDFNNLIGTLALLVGALQSGETEPRKLDALRQMQSVMESATRLTRALSEFARRGPMPMAAMSLNDAVHGISELFGRAVSEKIKVDFSLLSKRQVMGDRSRLEQVAMNLAVNARDAVGATGQIAIRTYDTDLYGEEARSRGLKTGTYAVLEISDSGPGIDAAVRDRIFEPYFTTKNKGTGLGLSTVHGIVGAHGGAIEVADSKAGATLRVYLPALE